MDILADEQFALSLLVDDEGSRLAKDVLVRRGPVPFTGAKAPAQLDGRRILFEPGGLFHRPPPEDPRAAIFRRTGAKDVQVSLVLAGALDASAVENGAQVFQWEYRINALKRDLMLDVARILLERVLGTGSAVDISEEVASEEVHSITVTLRAV